MIRLDCKTTWKCLNCDANASNEQIQLILHDIRVQVHRMPPNIERMEDFIAKYTRILHRNHYLLIEMKQKLAAVIRHMGTSPYDSRTNLYATINNGQRNLSPLENLLKRKIDLCNEFIPLLNILQPGISRLRAIAMYELFVPLLQLAKLRHQQKILSDAEFLVNIIISALLLSSFEIFVHLFAGGARDACLELDWFACFAFMYQN